MFVLILSNIYYMCHFNGYINHIYIAYNYIYGNQPFIIHYF
jgi:hypothetical protein